jgi:hypothetical protein
VSDFTDSASPSQRRRIINEHLFRDLNMRIKAATRRLFRQANIRDDDVPVDFACECSDPNCLTRIPIDIETYERIHCEPNQYVVVPSHQHGDIERVVRKESDYLVVAKFEELEATT